MSIFRKERNDVDVEAELLSTFFQCRCLTSCFVPVGEVLPDDDSCGSQAFNEDVLDEIIRAECRKIFVESERQQMIDAEFVSEVSAFSHAAK